MKMTDLIAKKKTGEAHTKEEIEFIINGAAQETIPDYQLSAWLMAVYFKGMDFEENAYLTEAMAKSGDILDLSALGEFVIDKHSTGGVGDKITLILIPLLAAAGLPAAKLSGRGLGHTGGTIDKLESIKGFNTSLSLEKFIDNVKNVGCAVAAQSAKLTPADGKLYALRDVTSTIDSIPLIASSVVSKKIASGANVIILDVKCGNGAFVKDLDEAEKLSHTMVEIGKRLNRHISAVITDMNQPLGNKIGNSLEVYESIEVLKGGGPSDVRELTLYLSAIAMVKAKKATSIENAKKILAGYLSDGSALEKFKQMVHAQGGDTEMIDDPDKLPISKYKFEVKSDEEGYVQELCAIEAARACKLLGAGRDKKEDAIDFSVGISLCKKIGDYVKESEALAYIYANSEQLAQEAAEKLKKAYTISQKEPAKPTLIYKIIE